MQTIDTLIFIILASFFLFGFVRGFIKELGAVLGFFISVWAAGAFYQHQVPYVKPLLKEYPLAADPLSIALSYIGLYIGASIFFHIVVRLLDQIFRIFSFIPFLKTANRILGGLVGFIEGLLLLSFLVLVIIQIPVFPKTKDVFEKSVFIPWLNKVGVIIKPLIPEFKGVELFLPDKIINQETFEKVDPRVLGEFVENYYQSALDKK